MHSKRISYLLAVVALALTPASVLAQAPAQGQVRTPAQDQASIDKTLDRFNTYPSILTYDRPEGQPKGRSLTVVSSSFIGGNIGLQNSRYGNSLSPAVSWNKGPAGTKSYVLVFEDGSGGRNNEGVTHWLAFNIPADVTSLAEGASVKGTGLKQPIGTMREGANIDNVASYAGMGGSPSGNHYHLQIFALDTLLHLPGGSTRDDVWLAMKHHVIASGQTVGMLVAPPQPGATTPEGVKLEAALGEAKLERVLFSPTVLTIDRPQGQVRGTMTVTSPSFSALGPPGVIPKRYTAWAGSISPEVKWSGGPKGTKSYVFMLEDGFQNVDRDGLLYWMLYDIPATMNHLPEGLSQSLHAAPNGPKQGANKDGQPTYIGMKGIAGAPPFHYHMEVFALDKRLDLPAGATRDQVRRAMAGHVMARGQDVAIYDALFPPYAFFPPAPTKW